MGFASVGDVAELLRALATLAWPLAVLVIVLRYGAGFARAITRAITERDVDAAVGPAKVTIRGRLTTLDGVLESGANLLEDLQQRISSLDSYANSQGTRSASETEYINLTSAPQRVLWVDDEPDGLALEIAALQERGVDVVLSSSTSDALGVLRAEEQIDAVITDLERWEGGTFQTGAGLSLIERIRITDPLLPVLVYTTPEKAQFQRHAALTAGALEVTASGSVLLELLLLNLGPTSKRRMEKEVTALFAAACYTVTREQEEPSIDLVADGRMGRLAIKVAPGGVPPSRARLAEVLSTAREASTRLATVELVYVVPGSTALVVADDVPAQTSVLSLRELRQRSSAEMEVRADGPGATPESPKGNETP